MDRRWTSTYAPLLPNTPNIKFLNGVNPSMCALPPSCESYKYGGSAMIAIPKSLLVSHGYTNLNTYDPNTGRIHQGYV